MSDIILVVLGILIGAGVGWFLASRREQTLARQLSEVKGRGARAVQIMKDEVTARLEQKEAALASLQTKLNEDQQSTAAMREQHARLEQQTHELNAAVAALRGESQAGAEQAFQELGQLHEIGASLERVVESFTRAVEAMESRLLVSDRRLKEQGGSQVQPQPQQSQPVPSARPRPEAPQPRPVPPTGKAPGPRP